MTETLYPILIFLAVMGVGTAVILIAARRRRSMKPRLAADESAMIAETPEDRTSGMGRLVAGVGNATSLGRVSARLQQQLTRAGYYKDNAATTYLGAKIVLLCVGVVGGVAIVINLDLAVWSKAYIVCTVAAVLFFAPNFILRMRRSKRELSVRSQLPNSVDLLEVCVSAGMGLDQAWSAVSEEIRQVSPTLADEMALANLEVRLGAMRTEAMRNMAKRTGAQELNAMVALLVQSDRFGTSIADALRTFATSMRETRSMNAEERAERMAVKLLIPLVLFIFPVMLVVMAGPAAITLVKMLG